MSRKQRIYHVLEKELNPHALQVDDETHRHHVPHHSESHFKVIAVSEQFAQLSRINRHRLVHSLLAHEFGQGLHALSLHLYSPDEWANQASVADSPACRDGMRHDRG